MDIGGTKVALRLVDGAGPVHESTFTWPTEAGVEQDMAVLSEHIGRLLRSAGTAVVSVGVAVPATLGSRGHVVTWPNRPSWHGLDLTRRFEMWIPRAVVRCADDGDLAALAEAREAELDNIAYIGVGTGVGGGIVTGGRLFPGPERGSCEIGHIVVDRLGPSCDCGRRGCVQALASGPATLRRASRVRGAAVSTADLVRGLADGCPWALEALEPTCAALATLVINLDELAHLDRVVVGGGFATALPDLVTNVGLHTATLLRRAQRRPGIERARLGKLSSLHGAELFVREGLA